MKYGNTKKKTLRKTCPDPISSTTKPTRSRPRLELRIPAVGGEQLTAYATGPPNNNDNNNLCGVMVSMLDY